MSWGKKALASIGVGLVALGLLLLPTSWKSLPHDRYYYFVSQHEGNEICKVQPVKDKSDVILNQSFTLNVIVSAGTEKRCKNVVVISAPAFDVKPESQEFDLPDEQGRTAETFSFLALPKEAGPQIVSINSDEGQYKLHYSVKTSEYIPAWMNPFLSPLLSVLGSILTVPWWIERRQKNREEAANRKAEEDAKNKPVIIAP